MAVTYTPELLARAEAHLTRPLNERRYSEGLAEISQLVADINGQANSGCKQCQYGDFISIVKNYTRAARRILFPETMPDSNYTLAPGYENETFVHAGYGEAVTADNLTDEAAKFFIKKGFGHAIVEKPATSKPAKTDETPKLTEKQQLQARYKELHGQEADEKLTIADLKQAIAAKQDPE